MCHKEFDAFFSHVIGEQVGRHPSFGEPDSRTERTKLLLNSEEKEGRKEEMKDLHGTKLLSETLLDRCRTMSCL